MRDKILALLKRHCRTIRDEAAQIDACVGQLAHDSDPAAFERAKFLVHRMKGSSGSLGFLPLSQSAELLETALKTAGAAQDREAAIGNISALNAQMQLCVSETTPEASHLYHKFAESPA